MKLNKQKLNYKSTIFLYIMMISFIPIIVLGVVSYRTYTNALSSKLTAQADMSVSQLKSRTDTALNNIRSYYMNEIDEDELEWLINTDIWYSDYSKLNAASIILAGPSYYISYISGYSFINFETEWVLSNRGMFKYGEVMNPEQVEELFHLYDGTLTRTFWVDHSQMEEDRTDREVIKVNGLCLVFKAPLIKINPNSIMIINIDQSILKKLLRQDLGDGDVTVLDKEGNLIYTTNKDVAAYCVEHYDSISGEDKIQLEEGREYLLSSANSGVLDWTYHVSYDMETLISGGEVILSATLLLLLLIVVVMLSATLMVKRIYKPVQQLTRMVKDIAPQPLITTRTTRTKENEFDYISKSIDNLVDKRNFFESMLDSQQPHLLELFQIRMLHGEVRKEQLETYLDMYKIQRKDYFIVMAGIIKAKENKEIYDETKQDALRMTVIENMPKEITQLLFLPPIRNERTLVLTVMDADMGVLEKKAEDICNQLNIFVHEQYGFHLSVGISQSHKELSEFRNAYHESLEAMKSNEFMGVHEGSFENNVLLYYSDIKENHSRYAYDRLSERELKEAIDANDSKVAFEIIDRFIDGLIENNVMRSDYYLHLHRLSIAAMLVATDAGLELNQIFDKDMGNNIFLKMAEIYDTEKMRGFLKNKVIRPIIERVNDFRLSRSSDTMKDIERLVNESRGNITLAACAERLNYHPSYIWKVTKMKSRITFTDYVGNYKVEKAKEMLLHTDMTIADIAVELNYTNAQNFIRFFSKLEGITPGKYRLMNKC